MIDLVKLKAHVDACTDAEGIVRSDFRREFFDEAIAELSACRAAGARAGQVFGLKPGESL